MAVAIVMLWLTAIAEVAAPVLVSYFIDNMVAKNQIVLSVTLLLVAGFVALQIAASLLHYFQLIYFNQAAVGVVQTLRADVMDAALRQPLSAFDTQPVGQLISRVTNDTEMIKDLFVNVLPTLFRSVALIVVMLIAMYSLEWRMALVATAMFPQ